MDNLKNRGKETSDDVLFGTLKVQVKLKKAVADMHYLLNRGYSEKSALVLVGNHYRLNSRQQQAVRQGIRPLHQPLFLVRSKGLRAGWCCHNKSKQGGYN